MEYSPSLPWRRRIEPITETENRIGVRAGTKKRLCEFKTAMRTALMEIKSR
jgi:hypothetical protein